MTEEDSIKSVAEATKALAPVAKALIDKFGIGRLYDPIHAKRMNKAHNKNRIRTAKTDLEIAKIRAEETKISEAANVDAIVHRAIPLMSPNARPEEISREWANYIKDRMKVVEDDDMRNLWAKIIVGEAEDPGSFSKRVIHEVSCLSKEDAEAFTALAGYVWTLDIEGEPYPILIISKEVRKALHIPSILLDANLVRHRSDRRLLRDSEGKVGILRYHEVECKVRFISNEGIYVGDLQLTSIGESLFPFCGSSPVDGVFENTVAQWRQGTDVDVF